MGLNALIYVELRQSQPSALPNSIAIGTVSDPEPFGNANLYTGKTGSFPPILQWVS